MNVVERFDAIANFRRPDRMLMTEWATWWSLTLDRWLKEGLPSEPGDYTKPGFDCAALHRYFGLDPMVQIWFPPAREHGIVACEADYETLLRNGLLFPEDAIRFSRYDAHRDEHERGECLFWFTFSGFFWFPRTLFGIEEHLYSFYDHPELMKRMNQDNAGFMLRTLEKLFARGYRPDFMTFAEDMSYNNGAMISKPMFEEFMLPFYRQVIPFLKENKVKVLIDSDGDVTECIEWFHEAGIEGCLPLEHQAGSDIAALRLKYPDFLFLGNFDKLIMHGGEAALRTEFERLLPLMRQGGFIPSVDHQTPPDVSLDNYRLYLKLFREYAEKI